VRRSATAVTEEQASELTLTLTVASSRPIQTWVRTAGVLDGAGKVLTAQLRPSEAELVKIGQRVRTFSLNSRSQMVQAKITRVTPRPGGATVEATLAAAVANDGARHLMEIVTERGPFLSVPNESIIEEGQARVVYLKLPSGEFAPRTIHTGITGELYTEIVDGLEDGDEVVSIGSFFVDADNKLKGGPTEP
jgi:Cu(I)/Ag(I) efflux system membrane fusion protein